MLTLTVACRPGGEAFWAAGCPLSPVTEVLTMLAMLQVERDRRQEAEQSGEVQEKLGEARSRLKKLDKKLKQVAAEGAELAKQAEQANKAKKKLVTRHAQAQVSLTEAGERLQASSKIQVRPTALMSCMGWTGSSSCLSQLV